MATFTLHDTIANPLEEAPSPRPNDLAAPLLAIARSTRALLQIKLAELGLFSGQDELLLILRPDVPVTVSGLAETLAVRSSTVSNMLDRLVERTFVQRASDTRDARRTLVRLTPAGSAMRARVAEMRERLEAELTDALTAADLDALMTELVGVDHLLAGKLAFHR